ncbi:alpha-xylosidase, partial [Streptomyces sp. NPDC056983]
GRVWVRPGGGARRGAPARRPDGDWADGVTLLVAPGARDVTVTVPDHDGSPAAAYRVRRDAVDGAVTVEVAGTELPYEVREL